MRSGPLSLSLVLWVSSLGAVPVLAQTPGYPTESPYAAPAVSLDEIPAPYRERCKSLLEKPTFRHTGAPEQFAARAGTYVWLLDHPDRAVALWRMIGAQCTAVERRGDFSFGWKDDGGNELRWDTIVRTGVRRVWYAEGKVKPAVILPGATVRALVVIHHQLDPGQDAEGRDRIRQRVEFILQTDSHLLALAARMMGASAPRLADQFCSQVQMFFGGLAWYLDSDMDRAERLLQRLNTGR